MRFLAILMIAICWMCPATAWSQRKSPSAIEALRRGRLPGETSRQLRDRLHMLESMDELIEQGAEASPTMVRLGPKYRGGASGMALLKDFYALEKLEIIAPGSQISDSGLAVISKLPSVRAVRFEGVRLTDTSLTHMARLPQLRQIAVIDTGISDNGFRSFAGVRSLEAVRISERKFTGEGLRHLQRNAGLSSLQLEDSGVTDESMKLLTPFRNLRFLSVTGTEVNDEVLMRLWNSHPDLLIVGSEGGKAAKRGELLGEPLPPGETPRPRQATRPRIP